MPSAHPASTDPRITPVKEPIKIKIIGAPGAGKTTVLCGVHQYITDSNGIFQYVHSTQGIQDQANSLIENRPQLPTIPYQETGTFQERLTFYLKQSGEKQMYEIISTAGEDFLTAETDLEALKTKLHTEGPLLLVLNPFYLCHNLAIRTFFSLMVAIQENETTDLPTAFLTAAGLMFGLTHERVKKRLQYIEQEHACLIGSILDFSHELLVYEPQPLTKAEFPRDLEEDLPEKFKLAYKVNVEPKGGITYTRNHNEDLIKHMVQFVLDCFQEHQVKYQLIRGFLSDNPKNVLLVCSHLDLIAKTKEPQVSEIQPILEKLFPVPTSSNHLFFEPYVSTSILPGSEHGKGNGVNKNQRIKAKPEALKDLLKNLTCLANECTAQESERSKVDKIIDKKDALEKELIRQRQDHQSFVQVVFVTAFFLLLAFGLLWYAYNKKSTAQPLPNLNAVSKPKDNAGAPANPENLLIPNQATKPNPQTSKNS